MQNSALYGEAYMCACRYASGRHVDCRKTAALADRGILCVSGSWNMLIAPAERAKGKRKGTRQEGRAKEWRTSGRFPCRTIAACRIGSFAERGGGTGYAGCRAGGRLLSADEGGVPPVCGRRKFQCRKGGHLSDSAVSKVQRGQKD